MSCCLNSNLLINHFMEKKSSLNSWLKRRFNQSQTSKLSDKEILQLEESKYIKKIGCSIPKYSIDENFKSDYFNVSSSESKQNDKDIIRLPNALAVNGLQQKSSNHRISKSSLNNDEWEIFFVLDETNKKANQQEQRVTDKTERNVINKPEKNGDPEKNAKNNAPDEDQKSEIDHLDLDDLEWDDAALAYDVSYDEDERLIFERPR